jgi:RimK-like ATP-grasp domain
LGFVAPPWDLAAGTVFRHLGAIGWSPLWLSSNGFGLDSDGGIVHEDFATPFESLDGVFVLSLCDPREPEMFSWRLAVLQELSRKGVRVEPDPFRLESVWDPVRMMLRLATSGLSRLPMFIGESLEDAVEFAKQDGCVHRSPALETQALLTWIDPSEDVRARLVELWEKFPEGPFLLMRRPEGMFLTILCVQGEALGAISWNLERTQATAMRKAREQLTDDEFALAVKAAAAFGLSICGVDIVRTPDGPKLLGVRLQGVLEAFGSGHPRFDEWLPRALEQIFPEPSEATH